MFRGEKNKKKHEQQATAGPDQDALLHEAYMLVRHLRGCYSQAPQDKELSLRLSCLFGHMFTPVGVERLLESLQRSFWPQLEPQGILETVDPRVATENGVAAVTVAQAT